MPYQPKPIQIQYRCSAMQGNRDSTQKLKNTRADHRNKSYEKQSNTRQFHDNTIVPNNSFLTNTQTIQNGTIQYKSQKKT